MFKADGTIWMCDWIKSQSPVETLSYTASEKWMDSEGAVFYKGIYEVPGFAKENYLIKISPDKSTLEWIWASRMELLPSDMEPDNRLCVYFIFNRLK